MFLESFLFSLFVIGLPLLSIFIQWMLIRRRLPWLGMLAGLVLPLLFWLSCLLVFMPKPEDCNPQIACEWVEFGLAVITMYVITVAVLATLAGFVIHLVYRKRIWTSDEIVKQTGKIPSLASIIALLVVIIYTVLLITGLLYRFSVPGTRTPYP